MMKIQSGEELFYNTMLKKNEVKNKDSKKIPKVNKKRSTDKF